MSAQVVNAADPHATVGTDILAGIDVYGGYVALAVLLLIEHDITQGTFVLGLSGVGALALKQGKRWQQV